MRMRVPGKVMLMGEYAVTSVHHPGVVMAVNRYLTVSVQKASMYALEFPDMKVASIRTSQWEAACAELQKIAVLSVVSTVCQGVTRYLQEENRTLAPFHLSVSSALQNPRGVKYGLGSSAAITVGLVASLLAWARQGAVSPDEVFKLSVMVQAGKPGSGADLSACTYGGVQVYYPFDRSWLIDAMQNKGNWHQVLQTDWPGHAWQSLPIRPEWVFRVGWTGEPASTPDFLQQMGQFRRQSPESFAAFLNASDAAVHDFVTSVENGQASGVLRATRANREALGNLSRHSGVPIETPTIQRALDVVEDVGGSGKSSGAGGGDIFLAWFPDVQSADRAEGKWRHQGIVGLPVEVDTVGLDRLGDTGE